MASHQSEPAKMEQIITEFFAKSLHIILESRCPYVSSRNYSGEQAISFPSPSSSTSSSSSIRPRDKWFNLALRDCPAALENIDFWRQSNLEQMVVDVIQVKRPNDWEPMNFSPGKGLVRNLSSKDRSRSPHYLNLEHDEFGRDLRREKIIERWVLQYETRKNCNKRSSCTSSHTLYKKSILLFRSLYVTVKLLPAYKLFRDLNSSGQIRMYTLAHRVSSFVEPFTRREEAEMTRYVFTPVDTSCGRLCLSVLYRSSISDLSSEPSSSTPMSPRFIPNYVGSPMADPLRRVPPFGRRHSWSYDIYRASPPSAVPSPSPSPTYSEPRASISKPGSCRLLPPTSLPRQLSETPRAHTKDRSFDEYWPSPMFSPSPSQSPPTLFRSESAPVSIPLSKLANVNMGDKSSGQVQTVEKLFSLAKEESGKLSRSSSKLSFQYDDDSECSGLFILDDDDVTDSGSRPGSLDQQGVFFRGRKSTEAEVGALVQMLKKASPLRQVCANSTTLSEGIQQGASQRIASAGLAPSRTTADALEELREYRKIRDSLLENSRKGQK